MTHIKTSDLEYLPTVVNQVMNINTLPNTTQAFGNPYPGEASIMEAIHHHKLQPLQQQFAQSVNINNGPHHQVGLNSDIYMNRGVNNDGYNTGQFNVNS